MARKFGSKDSYKRNSVNYCGRLRGAISDDTFGYWLRNQRDRGLIKPEHQPAFLRTRYLLEYFKIIRPASKRYRLKSEKIIYLWRSLLDGGWMRMYKPESKRAWKKNYFPAKLSEQEAQAILLHNRILIQKKDNYLNELSKLEKRP